MDTMFPLISWPNPLEKGVFVKRYKRFFVDVQRPSGSLDTVHCANSGSMKSCLEPGAEALTLDSHNPARKLRHSLELMRLTDGWACLNTARANQLVEAAFQLSLATGARPAVGGAQWHADFGAVLGVRREAVFAPGTRLDFCLERQGLPPLWVEVKSVSLRRDSGALSFPDAVTTRGHKHTETLIEAAQRGEGAVLLYVFMRGGAVPPSELVSAFAPAADIDPSYAQGLHRAQGLGVQIRSLVADIRPEGLGVRGYGVPSCHLL